MSNERSGEISGVSSPGRRRRRRGRGGKGRSGREKSREKNVPGKIRKDPGTMRMTISRAGSSAGSDLHTYVKFGFCRRILCVCWVIMIVYLVAEHVTDGSCVPCQHRHFPMRFRGREDEDGGRGSAPGFGAWSGPG